jgi:hypothetical protein
MTEQNREVRNERDRQASFRYLAEQEYGPQHPITKKLASMHADAQALLQEKHS